MKNKCPRTINVVQKPGLAQGGGPLRGRVTDVVPGLGTTEQVIFISLFGLDTYISYSGSSLDQIQYSQVQWGMQNAWKQEGLLGKFVRHP